MEAFDYLEEILNLSFKRGQFIDYSSQKKSLILRDN